MATVNPDSILQLNTALQLGVIGACMAHPLIPGGADWDTALLAAQSVPLPPYEIHLRGSLTPPLDAGTLSLRLLSGAVSRTYIRTTQSRS